MNRKTVRVSALFFFLLFFMASCTTTIAPNVWKSETYQGAPVKKVFVMAIMQSPAIQGRFEDEFVRQLGLHRTDASASYSILFHHLLSGKNVIASSVEQLQADSVLVTRLVNLRKEGHILDKNFGIPAWYQDLYSYYSKSYGYTQFPKYIDEFDSVIMETNLYEADGESLVWSARSEILTLICGCQEIEAFIKVMIDRLASDGFITPTEHNGNTEQKSP